MNIENAYRFLCYLSGKLVFFRPLSHTVSVFSRCISPQWCMCAVDYSIFYVVVQKRIADVVSTNAEQQNSGKKNAALLVLMQVYLYLYTQRLQENPPATRNELIRYKLMSQ